MRLIDWSSDVCSSDLMAVKLGLSVEFLPGDWRLGVDPASVEARLSADDTHRIKAVCMVHNETATGFTSHVEAVRQAIDRSGHPALFMVDTISSLASIDYRDDEWGRSEEHTSALQSLMRSSYAVF